LEAFVLAFELKFEPTIDIRHVVPPHHVVYWWLKDRLTLTLKRRGPPAGILDYSLVSYYLGFPPTSRRNCHLRTSVPTSRSKSFEIILVLELWLLTCPNMRSTPGKSPEMAAAWVSQSSPEHIQQVAMNLQSEEDFFNFDMFSEDLG
jgi:hypothetical protein